MKFRPCIDLHCGVVKQIVGSTLSEDAASAGPVENFVASKPAAEYAQQYQRDGLYGGHVIMLGPNCEDAALDALRAFPGGLQIGGGITLDNAMRYLDAGASHVVVTSFVFRDGQVDLARLQALRDLVGKERLVIDLSCRKRPEDAATPDAPYYVVTNKWTQVCVCVTNRPTWSCTTPSHPRVPCRCSSRRTRWTRRAWRRWRSTAASSWCTAWTSRARSAASRRRW
jgi:phosphoribosylformimino-5-aminoimidazole carboxamide ribotide isomerase